LLETPHVAPLISIHRTHPTAKYWGTPWSRIIDRKTYNWYTKPIW